MIDIKIKCGKGERVIGILNPYQQVHIAGGIHLINRKLQLCVGDNSALRNIYTGKRTPSNWLLVAVLCEFKIRAGKVRGAGSNVLLGIIGTPRSP